MTKYEPLTHYLEQQSGSVTMTYSEIEKILGQQLPPSASEYQEWWGNDDETHPQSMSWKKANYRVSILNLGNSVTFSRRHGLA
jgi:hypothetical protein